MVPRPATKVRDFRRRSASSSGAGALGTIRALGSASAPRSFVGGEIKRAWYHRIHQVCANARHVDGSFLSSTEFQDPEMLREHVTVSRYSGYRLSDAAQHRTKPGNQRRRTDRGDESRRQCGRHAGLGVPLPPRRWPQRSRVAIKGVCSRSGAGQPSWAAQSRCAGSRRGSARRHTQSHRSSY